MLEAFIRGSNGSRAIVCKFFDTISHYTSIITQNISSIMSSETSGGFSDGVRGGNQAGRAGTAGAGATDPTRTGGGAAKESVREMGQGVKSAAAGAHVSQTSIEMEQT